MEVTPGGPAPERLDRGGSPTVVRVGEAVRRAAGPWTPTIHRLLRTLRDRGVVEVPEPLAIEGDDEFVSFIPGTVANYPLPDWLWSGDILVEASALLRRMHDATAGLRIDDAVWQLPTREPQEVICHNDFAPYNLVFDEGHLRAAIDFDTASPGPRIWDFAYFAYRLVPFGSDAGAAAPDDGARATRLEAAIDAYGATFSARAVLQVMATRLEALASHTEGRAAASRKTELAEHVRMYRSDARRIVTMLQAG